MDLAVLFVTVFYTFYAFSLTFIACENGEQITDAFNEVHDVIGQLYWYRFPVKIKHVLATILIGAQGDVAIECFGSVSCNREAFKKVRFSIEFWLI